MNRQKIKPFSPTRAQLELPHCTLSASSRYRGNDREKRVVTLGDVVYSLRSELPSDTELMGYLCNRADPATATKVIWQDLYCYPVYGKAEGRVVGYLPLEEGGFVAVCSDKPLLLLPLLWLMLLLVLLVWLLPRVLMVGVPVVVYSTDIPSSGSITAQRPQPLETDYFNIKINATPILEDGRMNLRLENSTRNTLSCQVEVVLEQGDGELVIYRSPIIAPDHSLEFVTVEEEIASGVYDGTATFRYFSGDEKLTTTSSVRLVVSVR